MSLGFTHCFPDGKNRARLSHVGGQGEQDKLSKLDALQRERVNHYRVRLCALVPLCTPLVRVGEWEAVVC